MRRSVKALKRLSVISAAVVLALVVGLGIWCLLPLPAGMIAKPAALSLALQDRHGLPLRTTRAGDGSRAGWISLEEMDPQLLQAFIALEDRRFFSHPGVDVRAVGRAAMQAIRARRIVSGASTITMQLARLLRPSDRDWLGKISQTLWALRLERHLTKQEILEQYLNRVPLGQGTVGVGAAAALYLNSSATQLSLGGAALLAGLAASPEHGDRRRAVALSHMVALGYADSVSAGRAAREPLTRGGAGAPFLAPHFTSHVLEWARDSGLAQAGVVHTSLDAALQAELEAEVRSTVALLRESEVREAAAVVLDNATGEILAWVGSPDFWADTAGQVDMVASPRQPGSALKPFLYALAFDRGVTAATVLADLPRTYRTSIGPYQPRNYDRRFHGPVRAREALASSFNIPAVELTDRFGAGTLLRVLHQAGFASLNDGADEYGLGIALGNGDVTLLELANAYRGLANGGTWQAPRWLAASPGARADGGRRFASRASALLVLDILTDPVARIPGFGVETPFDFPFPVAVKTGTSHHFTDNWAVGVAANFTVAVWVGNFSGRPMRRISGVTGAGPLLHRAILDVAKRYDPGVLPTPAEEGAMRMRICRLSGMRAGPECLGTDEWFMVGTAPDAVCDWHREGRVVLPPAYASWRGVAEHFLSRQDDELRIISPLNGDRYEIPTGVEPRYSTIPLRAVGGSGDEPIRWYVDGRATPGGRWQLQSGRHAIRAVGASGRAAEVAVDVR